MLNDLINENKEKLDILNFKYDKLSNKFNKLTLILLILSSIATSINACSLLIADTLHQHQKYINFVGGILNIIFSTMITIITSIIRFRNYREKMERIRKYQEILNDISANLQQMKNNPSNYSQQSLNDIRIKLYKINMNMFVTNNEISIFRKNVDIPKDIVFTV